MNDLKVSIVQCELLWEAPELNRNKIESLLKEIQETDLILLPEMFTTGFSMDPKKSSEPFEENMETLKWMKKIAKEYNAALAGSVSVLEEDSYRNRLLWVNPDASYHYYDKKHLFSLTGEDDKYHSGNERLIVNHRGWNICPLICYDLRFPEWSRNKVISGKQEYDLLIYVANWPKTRIVHWDALIQARAIENQAYCIGVNRVGEDKNGLEYSGGSVVYNYTGDQLIRPKFDAEHVLTLSLNHKELYAFRDKLPFLEDQK